jgi:hypothetical protein
MSAGFAMMTGMDWDRMMSGPDGQAGVAGVLARLQAELGGGPLTGTRIVASSREMLRASREIEAAAGSDGAGAELWVGFQRAGRLQEEAGRYRALGASGVQVHAFGHGRPAPPVPGVAWHELALDRTALVNQWFVAAPAPVGVVLAAFETSPGSFGVGPAGDPRRSFAGFVSDDPRVVGAVVGAVARHGEGLAPSPPAAAAAGSGRMGGDGAGEAPAGLLADLPGLLAGELDPARSDGLRALLGADDGARRELAELAWAANALRDTARYGFADPAELPPLRLAPAIAAGPARIDGPVVLAATDDGHDPAYRGTRLAAAALAGRLGAELVLYDRSPELYLTDPYAAPPPAALLDPAGADRAGRSYLAEQLRRSGAAWAWPARGSGPDALADCLGTLPGAQVVLPAALAEPGLLDRVRGHSAAAFARAGARIHLADPDGRLVA